MSLPRLAHMWACVLAFWICAAQGQAETTQYSVTLSARHDISAAWTSSATSLGAARITIDHAGGVIESFELRLNDLAAGDLASAGPGGSFGPIHFHNYPQGGQHFFVQQLPLTVHVEDGVLVASLSGWKMEDPVKGIDSTDFVLRQIASGNAYIGVHTFAMDCVHKQTGAAMARVAPATAISGHVMALN